MEATIYALCDPVNPIIPRYIGKTKNSVRQRLFEHMVAAFRHPESKFSQWLLGLDAKRTVPIVLIYEIVQTSKAFDREKYWTDFFKPLGTLLNIKSGNSQDLNGISETRKRWLQTPKGQLWIEGVKASHRQRQPSLLLWAHQQHFKHLRTEGNKKRWRPVICIETGERFGTIADARRKVGKSAQALQDCIKHGWACGGFHWKYETINKD